jgi:hypothetical protein
MRKQFVNETYIPLFIASMYELLRLHVHPFACGLSIFYSIGNDSFIYISNVSYVILTAFVILYLLYFNI